MAKSNEALKVAVTHRCKSSRVDEERILDLSREVSQAASSAVVTTNCEKSAEAIVLRVKILRKG